MQKKHTKPNCPCEGEHLFYCGVYTSMCKQSYQIGLAPWVDHGSWEAGLESFPPLVWTCDLDLEMKQGKHI